MQQTHSTEAPVDAGMARVSIDAAIGACVLAFVLGGAFTSILVLVGR